MRWVLWRCGLCGRRFFTAKNDRPPHDLCVTCRKASGLE